MKRIKIVFAPLHFFYTNRYGSELLWAYTIFNKLSNNKQVGFIKGICYATVKDQDEIKLSNAIYKKTIKKTYIYNIFENLKFYIFYTNKYNALLKDKKIDILHHFLPFYIGKTFNPLFLFSSSDVIKVIGPVQPRINFDNRDIKNDIFFENKEINIFKWVLNIFSPVFWALSKSTLKNANKIIAINSSAKEELIKFGIRSSNIVIINPGVNANQFQLTKSVKTNKPKTELISVGYLTKRKGIDLIIRSLSIVCKKNKGVRLSIVGEGPQKKSLINLAKKLKLEKKVIFKNFVDNKTIAQYYNSSHIFVSMSRAESWGQMYLEAMASGLPIISAKNAGSESIIKDGKFGYLIEQEDYRSLAEKIIHLINRPELINKFGENARKEIDTKYDWDKVIIPKYVKLYNTLIHEKK
jgi:glycosyltransferase involved in cell wall biosynthesis